MALQVWKRGALAGIVVAAGLVILGSWPVTTRYGVNHRWSSKRIPAIEKTINFVSRDLQLRRLAKEVVLGASSEEQKALTIFGWVIRHVQPTPPAFDVVDDHVLNILIRGYGAPDQRAEALAVLASYNGMPSTAATVSISEARAKLVLTLVQVDGRITVFDVGHALVFRNRAGKLADLDDIAREPSLTTNAVRGILVDGVPYERYVVGFRELRPTFSRMEQQKLWPRIKFEVGRWVHLGGENKD